MKDRDGNEWRLVPVNATEEMIAEMLAAKDFDSIWPAAIAAAPQFVAGEVTDERALRVYYSFEGDLRLAEQARQYLAAWRSELGPAMGLVEIREPTPEECERMENQFTLMTMRLDTSGGRDMFDSVRAVMWPKEGL